jgi:hypothetical protein
MRLTIATFAILCTSVSSFLAPIGRTPFLSTAAHERHTSLLPMAGFGGGASSKKDGKKGTVKALKPKSQWDKFKSFKKESRIKAAARAVDSDSVAGEWYEVGEIKSEGDEFTELAIVLQRGIIAEVSTAASIKSEIYSIVLCRCRCDCVVLT